nr:MAG TPA: hypothetical protein [Caudoviricetes sp.]
MGCVHLAYIIIYRFKSDNCSVKAIWRNWNTQKS